VTAVVLGGITAVVVVEALGALHLVNLSGDGIAIQFQVLLLASLLWTALQQQVAQQAAAQGTPAPKRARTLTAQWSQVLQVRWRLRQPALRVLANCLAQPLAVYLVETLASVDVMVHHLVDHLDGGSRNALLGISNSIMLAEITANRMLDQIDPPA